MIRQYKFLRGKLLSVGLEHSELAARIDRSPGYVSARMTGQKPWTHEEMCQIMNIIGEPYDNLTKVFPPYRGFGA